MAEWLEDLKSHFFVILPSRVFQPSCYVSPLLLPLPLNPMQISMNAQSLQSAAPMKNASTNPTVIKALVGMDLQGRMESQDDESLNCVGKKRKDIIKKTATVTKLDKRDQFEEPNKRM